MRHAAIAGLSWATDVEPPRWTRGPLELYQHRHGRWVVTSPGCCAVAATPTAAVEKLRARIEAAAKALNIGGTK